MKKILLTSNGFGNVNLGKRFLGLTGREAAQLRLVFVPTAAITADTVLALSICMNNLLYFGILPENIRVYDLHRPMDYGRLRSYDGICFCPGSAEYLLERIYAAGFDGPLREFVLAGGVYLGISAGSLIASTGMEGGLGFLGCSLAVHAPSGPLPGPFDPARSGHIELTDSRAVLIEGDDCQIVE